MNGQGSPNSPSRWLRHCVFKIRIGFVVLCCAFGCGSLGLAQSNEIDLRLQVAWGGPTKQLWRGSIHVAKGSISDLRLLRSGTDQPGTYFFPQPASPTAKTSELANRILVSPRFPLSEYGIDIRVRAPADADVPLPGPRDRTQKPAR